MMVDVKNLIETEIETFHVESIFLVQKAAKMAMGLLPTKKGLIQKVVPDNDDAKLAKAKEDFPKAVNEMRSTYNKTQVFYKEHNLLDIP